MLPPGELPPPTWQRGNIRLWLGDSVAIAPKIEGVQAVIADPPYGLKYFHKHSSSKRTLGITKERQWHGKASMIQGDDAPFDPTPWLNFPQVCLWGGNHFAHRLPPKPLWLVWDKIVNPQTYGKLSFADCEMAWTNGKGTAKIYHHLWQGCRRAGEGSNKGGKLHPNQKPINLMAWCIDQLKVPTGALILDPYMSVGTTIIAAIRLGHPACGIEIDERFFHKAVARINAELDAAVHPQ